MEFEGRSDKVLGSSPGSENNYFCVLRRVSLTCSFNLHFLITNEVENFLCLLAISISS